MNDEPSPTARYQIQDSAGTGGTGMVFRAWDHHLQRPVAIKRLRTDVDMDADLRREAGILAALNHPNIVTIYDFASDEVGQFAVMEYVDGSTLDDTVARQPLTVAAFVELANQVCRGLSAAHSRGLVHLDLKPGNLMLQWHDDQSFTCKILDFGIAHLENEAKADDTDDGSILGSPYTVSPEQLLREPVDARTDLYSLGCVFYYALSGREPFAGGEITDILQRHLDGTPTPLHFFVPGVPEPLSQAIARMTARAPADRPQSAEEVRRSIQTAMRAPSAANRPRGPVAAVAPRTTAPRPAPKGSGGTILVLAVLLALGVGGWLYFRGAHPVEPTPEPATAAPAAPAHPVVDVRNAQAVAEFQGQVVTGEGVVTSCEQSVLFGARLLKFSDDQKSAAMVSVGDGLLSMESAQAFVGKRVRATGQVSTAANRTRLVLASAADLVAVER